ncbi:MAG: hypothetical protein H0T46_35820 [Deltaproteobacteria bacterium]|nr:hypothetical protein [Deltaproteobacteria bacterium]
MKLARVMLLIACAGCKEKEPPPRPHDPDPPVNPTPPIPTEKPSRSIMSPLPEKGPHPEYPTAAAAGTDKIFFIEEPDRGPAVPASYALPPRESLTWLTSPYCEVDALNVVCMKGAAPPVLKWRVGRAKGVTIAEKLRGDRVTDTWVFLTTDAGAPRQRLHLDEYGMVDRALLFTQPGRFTGRLRDGGNDLPGCGMQAYVQDAQKRIVELSCLQWLGDPMRDTAGVAIHRYTYDAKGLVSAQARFGIDGTPVMNVNGVHKTVYVRDALGRMTVEESFDLGGQLVLDTDGCAKTRWKYSAAGTAERSTCLDATGEPTKDGDGVATRTYRYDAAGCWRDVRHLDERDGATSDHDGLLGYDYEVDDKCATTTETCIGPKKTPAPCGPGKAARTVNTVDARGYATSVKHFDASGAPATDGSYRVHELRYIHDDAGHLTDMKCFDEDGDATQCSATGFHGWRKTFDDAGRETVQTFYNERGAPAMNMGVSQRKFRYDNYDHEFESLSLDTDGSLIEANGMAIRRTLWDATHRMFAIQLLDAKGNPAKYTACYTGSTCPKQAWHAVRIHRRPNGRVAANQFFDADGQWMETIDCAEKPCFDTY